jgi:hypothetical protein
MSAAIALIAYARTKGVDVRLVDGTVRLSGTQQAVQQIASPLRPYRDALLCWFQQDAANEASATTSRWQSLAQHYHAHHFGCATCISAGQSRGLRCSTGLELWGAYLHCILSIQQGEHHGQT